jgi:acetyl esterase/lipase
MFYFSILKVRKNRCQHGLYLITLAIVACALASSSKHAISQGTSNSNAKGQDVTVYANLAYGTHPDQVLDLCKIEATNIPQPVLVLIHGGGWTAGDKSSYTDLCKQYAARGIATAAINYRLFNKVSKVNRWPSQIVDAQLAVRWLRVHATQHNLNATKICAYGDSAGAHLALLLGSLNTEWPSADAILHSEVSSSVACVVNNFGPTDLPNSALPLLNTAKDLVATDIAIDMDNALKNASPLFYVNPSTSPTLIVQGNDDTLVPKFQSTSLRDAMLINGVKVEYLEYNGGHQYKNLSPKERTEISNKQVNFIVEHLER